MLGRTMATRSRMNVPRERLDFNTGWRFHRGDAPDARGSLKYERLRDWLAATGTDLINEGVQKPIRPAGNPGAKVSFVQPEYDDRAWRQLDLPHDWGIEGPFSQKLPGETGKLKWQGVGWYRKRFRLPKSDAARRIALRPTDRDQPVLVATDHCGAGAAGCRSQRGAACSSRSQTAHADADPGWQFSDRRALHCATRRNAGAGFAKASCPRTAGAGARWYACERPDRLARFV